MILELQVATNFIYRYSVWLVSIIIAVVLIYAMFIDFLPVFFGGYADRRLLLCFISWASVVGCLTYLFIAGDSGQIWLLLWPFALVTLCLGLIAHYSSSDFGTVEPIFYALFFNAFGLTGACLVKAKIVWQVLNSLILIMTVVCFFYGAMSLTVYVFAIVDDFSNLDNVIPWGYVNIRYWSHIATWVLPLLPLATLMGPLKKNRLWEVGVIVAGTLWWWIVFLSSARGTLAAMVVALLMVVLMFRESCFPWLKVFFKHLGFGVIAWLFLSIVVPSFVFEELQIRSIGSGVSGRWPLWEEAWAMSLQTFPFGMGSQSWLTHEVITDSYQVSKRFGHPHNMYLMWAAEYGWLTVGAMALPVVIGFNRLLRRRRRAIAGKYDSLSIGLVGVTASVIAALTHAGVSAVFLAPASMLVGYLILSVFWAIVSTCGEPLSSVSNVSLKRAGTTIAFALMLSATLVGASWLQEVFRYHRAMVADLAYYDEHVQLGKLPRFWFHGNFPRHPSMMPQNE